MTLGGIDIKTEINFNTIVVVVGFLGTFAGLITLWNGVQFRQEEVQKWVSAHEQAHNLISEEIKDLHNTDNTRMDTIFRMGQLEKAHEGLDIRISRITENYGNQFTEIRNTLGQITLQLALTNQALQRMEALNITPPHTETGPRSAK